MKRFVVLIALALVASSLPALAKPKAMAPGQAKKLCTDRVDEAKNLSVPVEGETATGRYAAPATAPKVLLVIGHGYGHTSESWIDHMRKAAAEHGVLAVAMDYRGTYEEKADDGTVTVRGWFVKEGADDMIAATHLLQDACTSINYTVLLGVSMGGNSTGLALANAAEETNPRGGPLFDYWFDIEGAVNVVETYMGASALAPANAFAANAKADIEAEMGGTIADDPQGYADLAVVSHMDEIKASRVQGVVMVHAVEDGLVPYNQSRELAKLLLQQQIAYEMHTVTDKDGGESGTTISGYTGQDVSPMAGHASEKSTSHAVMRVTFQRLWELVDYNLAINGALESIH